MADRLGEEPSSLIESYVREQPRWSVPQFAWSWLEDQFGEEPTIVIASFLIEDNDEGEHDLEDDLFGDDYWWFLYCKNA